MNCRSDHLVLSPLIRAIVHSHYTTHCVLQYMTHIPNNFSQVGNVSYCEGQRSLTDRQERKQFTRHLGKNKVS